MKETLKTFFREGNFWQERGRSTDRTAWWLYRQRSYKTITSTKTITSSRHDLTEHDQNNHRSGELSGTITIGAPPRFSHYRNLSQRF